MDSKDEKLMYSSYGQKLRKKRFSLKIIFGRRPRWFSFAGYNMPLHYSSGIMNEHNHTRDSASLFDVSHMGQIVVSGSGIAAAMEKLMPIDLQSMPIYQQHYGTDDQCRGWYFR